MFEKILKDWFSILIQIFLMMNLDLIVAGA
jgi:hypothetical protein